WRSCTWFLLWAVPQHGTGLLWCFFVLSAYSASEGLRSWGLCTLLKLRRQNSGDAWWDFFSSTWFSAFSWRISQITSSGCVALGRRNGVGSSVSLPCPQRCFLSCCSPSREVRAGW